MTDNSIHCAICESSFPSIESVEHRKVPCHVQRFSSEMFTVWRCSNCLSLHSLEQVNLAPFYEHYPLKQHVLDAFTRIAYRNRLKGLKAQGLKHSDLILDYGCGRGLFVQFLKEEGFENVFGFDEFVPEYSSTKVLNQVYDAVVSYDVIEHVPNPKAFLEKMITLARRGGLVVIGSPNATEINLMRSQPPVELSQPYHRHILGAQGLRNLANQFGLKELTFVNRSPYDTIMPGVNLRFMWSYLEATGGMLDVMVKPPNPSVIFRSPWLLFTAFFGYFLRQPGNMIATFRNGIASELELPLMNTQRGFESSRAA